MRALVVFCSLFALAACEYEGKDIKGGPGIFVCESNIGRPTLRHHTDTFKMTRIGYREAILEFTEIDSGKVYRLHTTEDRDYNCRRENPRQAKKDK